LSNSDESHWEEPVSIHDDSTHDSARPDCTLISASPEIHPCGSNSEELYSIEEESTIISNAGDSSIRESNEYQLHYRPPVSIYNKKASPSSPIIDQFSSSLFNLDLPEFGNRFASENFLMPHQIAFPRVKQDAMNAKGANRVDDGFSPPCSLLSGRENISSETECQNAKSAAPPIAKVNCGFYREEIVNEFSSSLGGSSHLVASVHNEHQQDNLDPRSTSSVGERSYRFRVLDFNSLRRRLPLKYSRSMIDDVLSVLQHLTVSGSSVPSSRQAGRRLSKAFTSSSSQKIDQTLNPSLSDSDLTSPSIGPSADFLLGASPGYCWEQITPKVLRRSNGLLHPGALTSRTSDFYLSAAIRINVLNSLININRAEDFSERDAFGNSVLHITASLSQTGKLENLIKLGADINSVNNAGQTFLHLVAKSLTGRHKEIDSLLRIAQAASISTN